ncbi:Xpo1 domain containing protein [Trichuris trichiura]|uniref:Xpo1 domain containing protein n=1 Tax=Trichuris trichiura TaxID=36087 RepID=A0A077Z1L7_TRITR|nr:Xpo1 domain containing protein [Trichuris trichiura]
MHREAQIEHSTYAMAQQVFDAVQCIHDFHTDAPVRQHAHELLEEVKESDACLDIGFELLQCSGAVLVQHCGLLLVEHAIRYQWNKLSSEKRVEVKNRCMSSISTLTGIEGKDKLRIMDGLAKCVVEMVKREWPQAWPEFMEDCEKLCSIGTYQTEVVLFMLSRLVEDVVILNSVEHQQQNKQLHSALMHYASTLVDLPLNVVAMSQSFPSDTQIEKENVSRLCSAALELLGNVLNWVPAQLLNSRMPKISAALHLCLESTSLSLAKMSAYCLNQVFTRKGPKREREPLLPLLSLNYVQPIVNVLRKLASHAYDENTYDLFKAVLLLFQSVASSLSSHWGYTQLADERESVLKLLLCTCLFLLRHPSLIGQPTSSEEPDCTFSRADYNTDEEFMDDVAKVRERCLSIIRKDVQCVYAPSYDFVLTWLRDVLRSPELATSSFLFHSYLSVYSTICEALLKLDEDVAENISETAVSHLDMVMKAIDDHLSNPECLTELLSLVTGLFPFQRPTYSRLPEYLTKLISLLIFDGSERYRCVNIHVSHQLVKLSSTCRTILLPHFDHIWSELRKFGEKLTDHIKCNMVDVLFELSNGLNSYDMQHYMTSTLTSSTVEFWNSEPIVRAVSSSENFLEYIGLFQPICTNSASDMFVARRKQFLLHTEILYSVLNHISLNENVQALSEGGFTVADSSGAMGANHPAFDTFQQLLPAIFSFACCLNGICQESCIRKIHPSYGGYKVLDLTYFEKSTVMGTYHQVKHDSKKAKLLLRTTVEDHVRGFFADVIDNTFKLASQCVCRFGWQFYAMPQASAMLRDGLLGNHQYCLDYRLHMLIRKALIPIVNCCREEQFCFLLSPLASFFPHCYQRLSTIWQLTFENTDQTLHDSDGTLVEQEMFLDNLSSMLTRDVAALLRSVLAKRPERKEKYENGSAANEDEEEASDQLMLVDMSSMDIGGDLSPLGKQLLNEQLSSFSSLVLLMFHMLCCPDSVPVINVTSLCCPVVVELLDKKLLDDPSARHLYSCILQGVQQHNQLEDLLGKLFDLGWRLYDLFRAPFPNACKEVLLSIPGISKDDLEAFDEKMQKCSDGSVKIPDKVKRTMFKKLVKPIAVTN